MFVNALVAARFDPQRPLAQLLSDSQDCRLIVFGFGPGQEIPAHTSTSTVAMHVLLGRGQIRVGDRERKVSPGDLAVCPPHVTHSMAAAADSRMVVLAVIAPRP